MQHPGGEEGEQKEENGEEEDASDEVWVSGEAQAISACEEVDAHGQDRAYLLLKLRQVLEQQKPTKSRANQRWCHAANVLRHQKNLSSSPKVSAGHSNTPSCPQGARGSFSIRSFAISMLRTRAAQHMRVCFSPSHSYIHNLRQLRDLLYEFPLVSTVYNRRCIGTDIPMVVETSVFFSQVLRERLYSKLGRTYIEVPSATTFLPPYV